MALIPLQIPPGVYRNGTDFESSNRWRDSNLVRWNDGSLRPVGGWDTRKANASASVPRGLHAWVDNSGGSALALGSHNKLYYINASSTVSDITPAIMVLSENPPLYGFTISESLMPARQLRCFASGYGKVDVAQLGRRAEVRLPGALKGPRARINCTMPAGEGRWRWLGRQFLTR